MNIVYIQMPRFYGFGLQIMVLLLASILLEGCQSWRAGSHLAEKPLDVVIKPSILEKNPCYKAGRKIEVKGLMLHSVGCPAPSGERWVKSWNREDYGRACVHGFIDAHTGVVYQTLPWDHRGWHCASGPKGSGNNTHIGVEMCESQFLKYTHGATFTCSNEEASREMALRTYRSAVNLFAYLCHQYHLNPLEEGVIVSHAEGNKRGIASAHADPEHLWRQLKMPLTMDGFRTDVATKLRLYNLPFWKRLDDGRKARHVIRHYGTRG